MVKWKFFSSIYAEAEWLESMAKQGWMLENVEIGMRYIFRQEEPADVVYEIENFALSLSKNARKQEVEAQKTAMDLITQTGWKAVTKDEAMNTYFVKKRENDESDELYDSDESRKIRADKYRKLYCIEQPKELMKIVLALTVIFSLLTLLLYGTSSMKVFTAVYLIYTICALAGSIYSISSGEAIFRELSISRQEWREKKQNTVKFKEKKVGDLKAFLKQKDAAGMKLVECDGTDYVFTPARENYRYYLDTKSALKKRMKEQGKKYQPDMKDWEQIGTKWHEQSMQEAQKMGLEVVCTVANGTLIYRCPESKSVDWDTKVEKLTSAWDDWKPYLLIGFCAGIILGIITTVVEFM